MNRRALLALLAGAASCCGFQLKDNSSAPKDWVCPMDPDYRSDKPGVCPRCGMKLVAQVPDRIDYPLEVSHHPDALNPGAPFELSFRVINPFTGETVTQFETVHEKLMHLFLVSENLEFFEHVHPELQSGGLFTLRASLPYGGMYRMLADYYPAGSVPQLAVATLYLTGVSPASKLHPSLAPFAAENLTAALKLDPEAPVAGLETKLFYQLDPSAGLQPYLGAWGHMLAASSDLVDLMHLHPFLTAGEATIQFNVIFPRPGLYRIWTQFERAGVVNTVRFTVPVKSL